MIKEDRCLIACICEFISFEFTRTFIGNYLFIRTQTTGSAIGLFDGQIIAKLSNSVFAELRLLRVT